jgi:hypothetical protein
MKLLLTTYLLIMVLIGTVNAQVNDAVFKVLATRGANKLKMANNQSKDLKAGSSVNSDATIEVVSNGMVGLMYKNGRTLELKSPGTYAVTELVKQAMNKSSSSITTQYAKYVMAQVTKGNDDPVSSTPGKNMGVTGAVMRSAPGTKAASINVYVPSTEILLDNYTSIHWSQVAGATGYTVRVLDMENTVLYTQESKDTTLAINLTKIEALKTEPICMVKVEAQGKNQHSAFIPLNISKLDPDSQAELKDLKEHMDKNSATDWISLALFSQRFNLNADAYHAFQMAISLAPDVPEYSAMFNDFQKQTKLKETVSNR